MDQADPGGEEEAPSARRGLTAIGFLEAFTADHAETVEELLEWPYRRVIAAMDAWRRRKAVEEINQRKLSHIAALYTKDFDPEKTNIAEVFEDTEAMYERLKDEIMMTDAEREAIDKAADTPFMRASRRSLAKAIERVEPEMPGQQSIQNLPRLEDPGPEW